VFQLPTILLSTRTIDHDITSTMDDSTPPEQRTATLLPVEKLKQLRREQSNKWAFNEFRLQGGTYSLKDFVDFCFLENGECDNSRIVWITENAFVRLVGRRYELPSGCYGDRRFGLTLSTSDSSPDHYLTIHSSTTEEAIAALDLLAGLQDSYFKRIILQYNDHDYYSIGRPVCPFTNSLLEKIVSNANRENRFFNMIFTPDQCRILATSGIRTNIGFWNCSFQYGGIAFVEASAARENQDSGPAKLSIWIGLPFDEGNFRLFLSQYNLRSLKLHDIRLDREESCRAVATADLQIIELDSCELEDGGAALVEAVREGRGPRALCLEWEIFDSTERFLSFINALRGNTYLQGLDLSDVYYSEGSPQALASALLENKGLVHFGLHHSRLDDHCWSELMAAISTHPTLRTLDFRLIHSTDGRDMISSSKLDRTKAVVDMLLVNEHIDEISFCCEVSFDRDNWNALVTPRLECNLYRKRFVTIPKIEALSIRAAVIAAALARVERKPSLIWMILSQNHDVVCSYLDEARDDYSVSVPLRKRPHSPSNDDVGAHKIQSK
jgi:hypothetical protein